MCLYIHFLTKTDTQDNGFEVNENYKESKSMIMK